MTAIDFLRPEAAPRLGWALLALGALALGTAMAFEDRMEAERVAAERQEQARAEHERDARRPVRVAAPTPAMIRLRHAEADARAPWLATLRVVEAVARDPVYLRSLVIEPATGSVKLEAEAPTFAEALAFAEALDDDGLLRPALVSSHEQIVDAQTGKSAVRFHVSARWNRR